MPRHDSRRATARTIAARAAAEQWTTWRLVSEIAASCRCSLLQAHRLSQDWTLSAACAQLAELGARVSVQQLSGWETGRAGRPGEENLDHLCRLFKTRPDRLGYGRDYTPGSESERVERDVAPVADTRLPAAEPGPVPAPERSLAEIRLSAASLLRAPVSETEIEQWERQTGERGHDYQIRPPSEILTESVGDFLEVKRLLAQRLPSDARTRLCRVAAQLTGTIGMALVALADHREARQWYHLGQILAEETGDRGLRAWLLAREAVIPFYFGAPAAALSLAERARLVAGSIVCATAAWAPALEARTLARMGRHRAAQEAMALAERAFERLSDDDTSDTAYGYTERQLVWHRGSMWTALGNTRRAQADLQRARELYAPGEHLDRALITMDEATSRGGG
ncbi:helix-turn-helix domain-containing protein [Streptomyces sp. NPDC058740]|uniref:helix-turn-helix domain-containing protein n=1 Tax=Streptomyces sp. NPDC058740 TaxID=3346619 RepID=UPI0036C0E430